jgi:hypothetical protein
MLALAWAVGVLDEMGSVGEVDADGLDLAFLDLEPSDLRRVVIG